MAYKYSFFTTNEIRPLGWLKRQLQLQADGLNGNLDKVWPDIRDSAWIGGPCEGWERVPYWLDGFVPMAYLLDDDDRKARAKKYVDKILENQEADGWICPNGETPREEYDTWAIMLIAKVLLVYYECSGDRRIPKALYRIMKNYYDLLSSGKIRLFNWAKARWYETLITLNFLAKRHPKEEWIPALAKILREQGTDYMQCTEKWKEPLNKWTYETHIVNLMMMLKYEAVSCDLLGEKYEDLAEKLYRVLKQYNRTAVETFTGDECLSGLGAIQGTELCAVVELMYTYEHLYAYTGDRKWAERMEVVAFNALPATISDDMWTHQYDQMCNQIDCTPFAGRPVFTTNTPDAHIFGLEPNYGCCTANFGQGWPKLALSSFMKSKDGVVSVFPIPAEVTYKRHGVPIKVTLETDYPFRNSFVYRVTAGADTGMTLRVRIPGFAKNIRVDGKPVEKKPMLIFSGFAKGETVIRISYEATPEFASDPYRLYHVRLGSLVFALPIKGESKMVEYEKKGVERKFPYCDYHIKGVSDWNFGFASRNLTVEEKPVDDVPFSSKRPALEIRAEVSHIDWGFQPRFENVCATQPRHREALDAPQSVTLYPYGCAKLRMTEMPILKEK